MPACRRDSTSCAMRGLAFPVTLLFLLFLLLLGACSAAPHGGSTLVNALPMAETLNQHSDGRPTTTQSSDAEQQETTTWIAEATGSEFTTHTVATAGYTAPPTTTNFPWTTHRDREGTTTTGDDNADGAATTQTQPQAWSEWATRASTLPNGALGDLERSDSDGVTAGPDMTIVTSVLEDGDGESTDAGTKCRDCATPGGERTVATKTEMLETQATLAPRHGNGAKLGLQHRGYDPANPYDHFDTDSEEQELEVEMEHHPQVHDSAEEESFLEYEDSLGATEGQPATTQRSYLLQLAGNSTIVMLRRSDFAKYLKLNLAARLSLEYDNVKVNRVLLEPPRLLVNVSVVTPDGGGGGGAGAAGGGGQQEDQQEEPLHALAEANATLLELSGEEYHVVRMLPLRARKPSRGDDDDDSAGDADDLEGGERYTDGELAAYCVLGGACAVVAVGALLLASARYLRGLATCLLGGGAGGGSDGGGGAGGGEALLQSFLSAPWSHRTAAATPGAPSVIYSGSLADATASWTSGLQPPPPQQPPPAPAASSLRLFGCRSTGLLLPPRRVGLPTKDMLQPLSTPPGHENPAYGE